jgi:hypothetical protein
VWYLHERKPKPLLPFDKGACPDRKRRGWRIRHGGSDGGFEFNISNSPFFLLRFAQSEFIPLPLRYRAGQVHLKRGALETPINVWYLHETKPKPLLPLDKGACPDRKRRGWRIRHGGCDGGFEFNISNSPFFLLRFAQSEFIPLPLRYRTRQAFEVIYPKKP